MNEAVKKQILETIASYEKILITRHSRPDGDAIGSSLGLARVLRRAWPNKDIRVINEDLSEYINFLGEEDAAVPDKWYADALGIVVDTGTFDRISNKKAGLCRQLSLVLYAAACGDIAAMDAAWTEVRQTVCDNELRFQREFDMFEFFNVWEGRTLPRFRKEA